MANFWMTTCVLKDGDLELSEERQPLVRHEVDSSNVHSFHYAVPASPQGTPVAGTLFVRFLGVSEGKRQGVGPLYAYFSVPQEKFQQFSEAAGESAGRAVWDYLRVRGSTTEHQHQFANVSRRIVSESDLIPHALVEGTIHIPRGGVHIQDPAPYVIGARWYGTGDLQEDREQIMPDQMIDLREATNSAGLKLRVDRKAGLIRGVKILGEESPNGGGRVYPAECRRRAIPLYEGKKVNVDHAEPGTRRSYKDRNGLLVNVREGGDGLYADYKYNPHHQLTEQLIWDAENAPGNVGFSHDARGRQRMTATGKTIIEDLELVRSVDLVAEPATVGSLFESLSPTGSLLEGELAKQLEMDDVSQKRWKLVDATSCLIRETLQDTLTSVNDKRDRMKRILDEWVVEAQRLLLRENKLPYSPQAENMPMVPAPTTGASFSMKESTDMELKDLTLVDLREQRADLLEAATKEAVAGATKDAGTKQSTLEMELASLKEELAAVKGELQTYRDKDATAKREGEIQEELKSAKGPRGMQFKLDDQTHVSQSFLESLRSCEDGDGRKRLIEDRLTLLESVAKPLPMGVPLQESRYDSQQTGPRDAVERQRSWTNPVA